MTSVIVLCWNHLEDITKPFVESFIKNTKGKFQLILVNNGSKDDTEHYVAGLKDKRVTLVSSPKNLGFSGGNNLGFKYVDPKSETVCFMNNDVLIEKEDWLLRLQKAVKESPNKVVGPHLVTENSSTVFMNKNTYYVNGWCVFAKKEAFEKVAVDGQVFDESFGPAYFEDVWLSFLLQENGYTLDCVPELGLVHLGSRSSDQISISQTFNRAKVEFLNKMTMYHLDKKKGLRIVFFAGGNNYGFIDEDYEGKGVGGAEAAIIQLARAFAKKGHTVEIYNNTKVTGVFNGVTYLHVSQFMPTIYCDIFILFRNFHPAISNSNALHKIFWSCDQHTDHYSVWQKLVFPYIEKVVCISPYHEDYLYKIHNLPKNKIKTIELGVKWEDYENVVPKQHGKAIFCSVPGRGLDHLARVAPLIKERVPEFQLYITSDYRLWGVPDPLNENYREMFAGLDWVHFLGKVGRGELVKHQNTSQVMAYPCTYEECFCISAMECIAAGAVPVTTDIGAMSTTVGDCGIVLSNTPGPGEYDKQFVESVVNLLTRPKTLQHYQTKGRSRASQYSWDKISDQWIELFKSLDQEMEKITMPKCQFCDKDFKNSYLLNKHSVAKHGIEKVSEAIPGAAVDPIVMPSTTVLRFKKSVEVFVNGHKYEGTSPEVLFEHVDTVLQVVRTAYGEDMII